MTGLVTEPQVSALANPEPTADRMARAYGKRMSRKKVEQRAQQPAVVPGLSLAGLRQKYSTERAYAPRPYIVSIRVPVGVRLGQFQRLVKEKVGVLIREKTRQGFDFADSYGVQRVGDVLYPAVDLATGKPMPDMCEVFVRAWFIERQPEIIRTEVPSSYFEERTLS